MSDPEPPFDLGKFYVLGIIGEGGTGIVYAAQLGAKLVALKVLRTQITLTERECRAFVAEAERMRRVEHPSLVPVVDVGTLPDGRPYIAMPRLLGENLATRLGRGPYAADKALALFEGLAGAVSALHGAGVIHRDIKPENIFVEKRDDEERLVLLDLGIAREIDAPASTTTQQGLVRGTPAYMAPERFFGAKASISTDVYELAVVLYIMLTGGLPWNPEDPKERLSSVTAEVLATRLPREMAETLSTALSMSANSRYATADDLLEDVRRGLSGARPSGAPIQVTPNTGAPMRPSEIAVLSSRETQVATPFPANATTARPRRGRSGAVFAVGVAAAALIVVMVGAHFAMKQQTTVEAVEAGVVASTAVAPAAASSEAVEAGAGGAGQETKTAATQSVARSNPRPPPSASASVAADAGVIPAKATGDKDLPTCRRVLALYCSPEWKATEGANAGALCAQFATTLKTWEALSEDARAPVDATCVNVLKSAQSVLATRKQLMDGGVKPP